MGALDKYLALIHSFVIGDIRAEDFSVEFINCFKNEKNSFPEHDFLILDKLFGDADAYTDDLDMLQSNPDFFVDSDQLKERARLAFDGLKRARG